MSLDLGAWAGAALGHWQGWLSGGGVGGAIALAIEAIERLVSRDMPRRWYATVILGGFFVGANYTAWHDAYLSMKGREKDLHLTELRALKSEAKTVALQAAVDIISASQPREPQDSLRRSIAKLALEANTFQDERTAHHGPYGHGYEPNAGAEQQKINEASTKYDVETERLCLERFEARTRVAVQGLKAAGINLKSLEPFIGFFEVNLEQHRCFTEAQNNALLAFARQLDASGHLATF